RNSRQYNGMERKFSYTLYDALGRVYEAGEKAGYTNIADRFHSVFGETVSGQYNPDAISDQKFNAWLNGNTPRREVTRSYYDKQQITGLPASFTSGINQGTQQHRITHVTYEDEYDANDQTYEYATHY